MEGIWEKLIGRINQLIVSGILVEYFIKILGAVLTIIASQILIKLGNKFINNLLKNRKKKKYRSERRRNTMMMLLKSILRYGMYFFAVMIILSLFNVPVASLLAGAGIIGVAIGFGAQNLVKDIINGFFILFEDQFGVGDYIKAAGVEGIVEEIGLRTTNIRDFGGELHIVPNSEITQVTNYSAGNMRVMVDVGVSYEEEPAHVIEVLEKLCSNIAYEKSDVITDGPRVLGVQELAASSVVIRIWAMVRPMEQWQVSRYIRQRVKETFDEVGIKIAYPHMVLVTKNEEQGRGLVEEGISDR